MIPEVFFVYMMNLVYPLSQQMEDASVLDFSLNGWILKIALRDLVFGLGLI